jgi:hypothetical protein
MSDEQPWERLSSSKWHFLQTDWNLGHCIWFLNPFSDNYWDFLDEDQLPQGQADNTQKTRINVKTGDAIRTLQCRYSSDPTRFRYPHFRISAVLFQCYERHQYPNRGQILKPVTCVEPFAVLSGNVMQMTSLASKNSGASLTSKWRLLHVSRFTRFCCTRRFAGTEPPCITRVACIHFFN